MVNQSNLISSTPTNSFLYLSERAKRLRRYAANRKRTLLQKQNSQQPAGARRERRASRKEVGMETRNKYLQNKQNKKRQLNMNIRWRGGRRRGGRRRGGASFAFQLSIIY